MDSYLGRQHPAGSGTRALSRPQKIFLGVVAAMVVLPLLIGAVETLTRLLS